MHGGRRISSSTGIDVDLTADERGMGAALAVARRGLDRGELPIGAVVVADGQVVGSSHTEEVTQRRLLVHAELLALEEADRHLGWDRRSATLYTTLEPCLMCVGAAATALVGRVVWAVASDSSLAGRVCRDGEARRSPELPQLHLPELVGPVGEEAASELFRTYVDARGDSCDPFVRWAATLIGHERAVVSR
ncbi:MAG TPA: nucleoside deaminase [Acidimicrobiales bacterium]|nr:nucleoside deaminase [Acidimicrobiales bacterium]